MKFYGPIGYAETVETKPGVWEEQIAERMYYGDLTRNTRRLQSSETLNDDINVANEITLGLWVLNGRFQMLKFSTRD